ncbi:hypothetical protein EV127DRAFT_205940 [Xylaria flabelliformis]|nr:hypothetical protein EV127DRAFT_205940 [Xylaria flabelliformis]
MECCSFRSRKANVLDNCTGLQSNLNLSIHVNSIFLHTSTAGKFPSSLLHSCLSFSSFFLPFLLGTFYFGQVYIDRRESGSGKFNCLLSANKGSSPLRSDGAPRQWQRCYLGLSLVLAGDLPGVPLAIRKRYVPRTRPHVTPLAPLTPLRALDWASTKNSIRRDNQKNALIELPRLVTPPSFLPLPLRPATPPPLPLHTTYKFSFSPATTLQPALSHLLCLPQQPTAGRWLLASAFLPISLLYFSFSQVRVTLTLTDSRFFLLGER